MGGNQDLDYPATGTNVERLKWRWGQTKTPFWAIVTIALVVMAGCRLLANWLINDHWLTDLSALIVATAIYLPLLRRAEHHYAHTTPET